jgi:mono/diheme cytochrome c family protein
VVGEIATMNESTGNIEVKSSTVGTGPKDCFLPRAALVDEEQQEIFVSCLGIDAVIVYDASKKNPHDYEKRRIPVPAGPTGLAIDPDNRRVVVFSSFAGEMTFVPLESMEAKAGIPSTKKMAKRAKTAKNSSRHAEVVSIVLPGRTGLSAELALGRRLFHSVGRRNIALDGRACASCHPDGRDDGLTWQTQEGPRQTPMLLGRISEDTAPFGWLGDKTTLPSHFKRTIERLAGTGLKDSERDAIFAYVNSLSPPKSGKTADDTRIAQGKAIFESTATGCSSCHLGEATTDGDRHDVKSAGEFEVEHKFETPSLRFIAHSAPYFHDGRYTTLIQMIQHCNGDMGTTKHLGDAEKESLAAYMQTL